MSPRRPIIIGAILGVFLGAVVGYEAQLRCLFMDGIWAWSKAWFHVSSCQGWQSSPNDGWAILAFVYNVLTGGFGLTGMLLLIATGIFGAMAGYKFWRKTLVKPQSQRQGENGDGRRAFRS